MVVEHILKDLLYMQLRCRISQHRPVYKIAGSHALFLVMYMLSMKEDIITELWRECKVPLLMFCQNEVVNFNFLHMKLWAFYFLVILCSKLGCYELWHTLLKGVIIKVVGKNLNSLLLLHSANLSTIDFIYLFYW
jgi:hypothetical protein